MSDPVVLPKFELPGEKPHWAVRAAWSSTAVLVVAIVGLVGILMHRHTLEVEAHVKREEALARVKAEAAAKVAAAAAAKAGKTSTHRSHSGHGGKGSKTAAKAAPSSAKDSTPAVKDNSSSLKPKNGKPDPIDDMLRKMK